MTAMTGGEIVARILKLEGVEKVFGIVDGTYMGFVVALRKEGIEIITPRHETCAAHMAAAYARLTGRLGVCMASNGPGVANILPGVAVENAEGNRVLLITSSRRTGIAYPDRGGTYQYFNHVGVIKPMAKWSGTAQLPERISEMMRRALRVAYRGRPGVVHVDVPENLMNGKTPVGDFWQPTQYRRADGLYPQPELVERAAQMLLQAAQPILHVGSGIIHAFAFEELATLAELLHVPVTTSWAARAAFNESSPLAVPMIYVELNHRVRNDADCVLAIGTRFGETDWWGKAPYWRRGQSVIQVDNDEENLGMNKPVSLAIPADARLFLAALIERLKSEDGRLKSKRSARERYIETITKARREARAKLDAELADESAPINPAHVGALCRQFFDDDAIVVFDGGNAAVWGNFYHEVRAVNTVLSTFKMGMLGAGTAQALGAAAAFPNRQVYCLTGDGAMGFHPQELETAVRHKLKVIFLVYCDRQWGMVKMSQSFNLRPLKTLIMKSLDPEETINTDLGEIHFDKLAESMRAYGERVNSPKALREALVRCRAHNGPALIHVDVNPVKHMWAPGLIHFKEMHAEPKG